jgi:glyoxylase-like metal-dependent hydrolase (beta-lactamase superfamily II)
MLAGASSEGAAQTGPEVSDRTIEQVDGNLYEVRARGRRAMLLVGRDGIALIDPLDSEVTRWLRQELPKRFPGRPVKYVVYSGLDFDRVAGASVLGAQAEVVAHATFNRRAIDVRSRLPVRLATRDANRNGVLEGDEIDSPELTALVARTDPKKTGRLTPAQVWSDVLSAKSEFEASRTIDVGGEKLVLVYAGPALGSDRALVYFPAQRILFASTHPSTTAPFEDRTVRATAIATWTSTVVRLGFDRLLNGSGGSVSHADVAAADQYVQALLNGVSRESYRGRSVGEIQAASAVQRFSGTVFEAQRDADIAAVYRRRLVLSVEVFGGGLVNRIQIDEPSSLCGSSETCEVVKGATGMAFGGGGSVGRLHGRAEVTTGAHRSIVANGRFSQSIYNARDRHVAMLGGVRTGEAGSLNVTWLGGLSVITRRVASAHADSRGSRGPTMFAYSRSAASPTFGADVALPISERLSLVVPVRYTKTPASLEPYFGTGSDLRAGVNLGLRLLRKPL